MRFRPIKAVLATTAILALAVGYFCLTPLSLAGVQVETDVCEDFVGTDTVAHGTWAGPLYTVAIEQPENCGYSLQKVAVQRIGSDLFVRTRYDSPSGESAACYCAHRTRLGIPGLPQQGYRVHVYSWP